MSKIKTENQENKFMSASEICKAYNISRHEYVRRVSQGKIFEYMECEEIKAQAETKKEGNVQREVKREAKQAQTKVVKKTVTDHLGNEFNNVSKMCEAYNINRGTYKYRIAQGCTQEEALTGPKTTDHLGNEFKSVAAMCEAYNINCGTYKYRIEQGCAKEEALTNNNIYKTTDHLGNEFNNVSKMCEAYNINRGTYFHRLERDWTQEEALTVPSDIKHRPKTAMSTIITDHLGNEYKYIIEMCETYNISRPLYLKRMKMGWTQEEALMTPEYKNPAKYKKTHKEELKKEKERVHSKIYYKAHKDEMNARRNAYREAHKEEEKAYHKTYHKAYYEANKEKIKASTKEYKLAHKKSTM